MVFKHSFKFIFIFMIFFSWKATSFRMDESSLFKVENWKEFIFYSIQAKKVAGIKIFHLELSKVFFWLGFKTYFQVFIIFHDILFVMFSFAIFSKKKFLCKIFLEWIFATHFFILQRQKNKFVGFHFRNDIFSEWDSWLFCILDSFQIFSKQINKNFPIWYARKFPLFFVVHEKGGYKIEMG